MFQLTSIKQKILCLLSEISVHPLGLELMMCSEEYSKSFFSFLPTPTNLFNKNTRKEGYMKKKDKS